MNNDTTNSTVRVFGQDKGELPVGVLRSSLTLDGLRLTLEYTVEHGYQVGTRYTWLARRLANLELASALIEACSLVERNDLHQTVKHVRTEYRRLRSYRFTSGAAREWAVINGALNRLEGKTLSIRGRHKEIEQWN